MGYKEGDYPIAEKLSNSILVLPLFVGMTQDDVKKVKIALINAIERAKQ